MAHNSDRALQNSVQYKTPWMRVLASIVMGSGVSTMAAPMLGAALVGSMASSTATFPATTATTVIASILGATTTRVSHNALNADTRMYVTVDVYEAQQRFRVALDNYLRYLDDIIDSILNNRRDDHFTTTYINLADDLRLMSVNLAGSQRFCVQARIEVIPRFDGPLQVQVPCGPLPSYGSGAQSTLMLPTQPQPLQGSARSVLLGAVVGGGLSMAIPLFRGLQHSHWLHPTADVLKIGSLIGTPTAGGLCSSIAQGAPAIYSHNSLMGIMQLVSEVRELFLRVKRCADVNGVTLKMEVKIGLEEQLDKTDGNDAQGANISLLFGHLQYDNS